MGEEWVLLLPENRSFSQHSSFASTGTVKRRVSGYCDQRFARAAFPSWDRGICDWVGGVSCCMGYARMKDLFGRVLRVTVTG